MVLTVALVVGERGEDQAQVTGGADGRLDVGGPLGGRVHDVYELGVAEVAEAEPEVERGPDHHDHVRAVEGGPAGLGEGERVLGREGSPTHAVGEDRDL